MTQEAVNRIRSTAVELLARIPRSGTSSAAADDSPRQTYGSPMTNREMLMSLTEMEKMMPLEDATARERALRPRKRKFGGPSR